MKVRRIRLSLFSAALMLAIVEPAVAAESSLHNVPNSAVQGKLQYCGYCHGSAGQGYRGYYPIPRLAGQQPEYIVNQLRAFLEGRRDGHMGMRMPRVHGVGPSMQLALAQRFSHLNAKPFGGGSRVRSDLGKKIFEEGVPEANIAACAACHGPLAQGAAANPRLAGQMYAYTVKTLVNWSKERGQDSSLPDSSTTMAPIARSMTRSQIEAVAAYVSTLK